MIGLPSGRPEDPTPEKLLRTSAACPRWGRARAPLGRYYLLAMVFLLFDIEIAFLHPWAVALRDLGWPGFVQLVTFFMILSVGYVYVWRKGVLDWGPSTRVRARVNRKAA